MKQLPQVLHLLFHRKADPNTLNSRGDAALHVAMRRRVADVRGGAVFVGLSSGADSGLIALKLAQENEHDKCVEVMHKAGAKDNEGAEEEKERHRESDRLCGSGSRVGEARDAGRKRQHTGASSSHARRTPRRAWRPARGSA